MTAPLGLAEIEETEAPALDVALVTAGVGTRRCACGDSRIGSDIKHGDVQCRPIVRAVAARVDYPAPEVTSRDHWDGTGAPRVVEQLAEVARKAGWLVRVQRSRGCPPHASLGTPQAVRWLYALRFHKNGASACAVRDGGTWSTVMLWSTSRPWFPLATVTDLKGYLLADGNVSDEWFDAIRNRDSDAAARKAARLKCDKGEHSEASAEERLPGPLPAHWCSLCDKRWRVASEPWRKPKTAKKDTAR